MFAGRGSWVLRLCPFMDQYWYALKSATEISRTGHAVGVDCSSGDLFDHIDLQCAGD